MNLMYQTQVEALLEQFQHGELTKQQTVWSLLDMPDHPDFTGMWEMLIVHIALIEIAAQAPNTERVRQHWLKEIRAWQERLARFAKKAKPSLRNAVKKHFYEAGDLLFKDECANLVLNVELHLEELLAVNEDFMADKLSELRLEAKEIEWFLTYPG